MTLKHDNIYSTELSLLKKQFFNTTPLKLHYTFDNESILTSRFLELLKQKLGTADKFLRKNAKERQKVAEEVQNLLLIETDWKALTSKVRYEENLIKKMFPKENYEFTEKFELFYVPSHITHKQIRGKYASEMCKKFCEGFINYLLVTKSSFLDKSDIQVLESMKEEGIIHQVAYNLVENLDVDFFFKDLVKICMKKAYDNTINIDSSKNRYRKQLQMHDEYFLFVKRTDLLYPIQNSVIIYFSVSMLTTLRHKHSKLKNMPSEENLISYIKVLFKDHEKELMVTTKENEWFRDSFNVAIILIDIFSQTSLVLEQEVQHDKTAAGIINSNVIYWLTHELTNTVPFSSHLPRIIPPKMLDTKKSVELLLSPYLKGELTFSPSNQTLKSLNIAQRKKFKVNITYLKVLDHIHNISKSKIWDSPFPTHEEIKNSLNNYLEWDSTISISALQRYINKRALNYLNVSKRVSTKKHFILESFDISDVSRVESDLNFQKKKAWTEYSVTLAKRQLLQTSLAIANTYIDFPIYYGTKLDFRTRMYPWEYLLSRTTGELKQLLCDYIPKKLTLKGLINLMSAYYRFSFEGSIAWHQLQSEERYRDNSILYKDLKEFFYVFNIEVKTDSFSGGDMSCYLGMLHIELSNVFKNDKLDAVSNALIEIDQVCSGITLLSILLGIPSLALETNLAGGKPRDIYLHIMINIPVFFQDRFYERKEGNKTLLLPYNKDKVLDFLANDRSCNKALLMRWGYGQGPYKRKTLLVDSFKEYHLRSPTEEEYYTLQDFSNKYDDFLESLFPNIQKQKGYLQSVLNVRIKAGNNMKGMSICTLDGCYLAWDVKPTVTLNKGYWNPVLNTSSTYKINVISNDAKGIKNMFGEYQRGLFPNLIHSIDAAIMRIIILKVYEKTGYIVNQLHDCVLCHPNIVNTVYDVIEEIYTDGTLHDLAEKVFFRPMKQGLSDDAQKEIDDLRNSFHASGTSILIQREVFNPKHAYVMEGTVSLTKLHQELELKGIDY